MHNFSSDLIRRVRFFNQQSFLKSDQSQEPSAEELIFGFAKI